MAIHLYFYEDRHGDIQLPPTDEVYFTICPPGYERREANTLTEVDALQKKMQAATYRRSQSQLEHDEAVFAASRKAVIDSLHARLASSCTTQYERDFIHAYIQLREEKRAAYRQRFTCDTAYLEMRENDHPRNAEEILGESL